MSQILDILSNNPKEKWFPLEKNEFFRVFEEMIIELKDFYFTEAKFEASMELFFYPKIVEFELNPPKRQVIIRNPNININFYLNDKNIEITMYFAKDTKKIGFNLIKNNPSAEQYAPFYEVFFWFYPIDSYLNQIEDYFSTIT